ncbi:hypothetical protein ACFWJ5_26010 [Streptomyces qaidamensis]|uniref:hypothetical protein n=1 Tax=Streptomyces qaidamensis TaxID=1783515 RepID=UPI003663F739
MAEQSEELVRRRDLKVVGVDKTVEAIENATQECAGRVHGLARDMDPIGVTDLGSHLLKR